MKIQSKVVFWIVFIASIVASFWFIRMSYVGLQKILDTLHDSNSRSTLTYLEKYSSSGEMEIVYELLRGYLEFDSIQNRKSLANSSLAMRTWFRFMISLFGSILILTGVIFVLVKVESSQSELSGAAGTLEISWKSSSPGLIMLLGGVALMIIPHFSDQQIRTREAAIYVQPRAEGYLPGLPGRPSDSTEAQEVLRRIQAEGEL